MKVLVFRAEKVEKQKLCLGHLIFCWASTLAELWSPFQTGRDLTRNKSAALQEGKNRVWRTSRCEWDPLHPPHTHTLTAASDQHPPCKAPSESHHFPAFALVWLQSSCYDLIWQVWKVQQGFLLFCVTCECCECQKEKTTEMVVTFSLRQKDRAAAVTTTIYGKPVEVMRSTNTWAQPPEILRQYRCDCQKVSPTAVPPQETQFLWHFSFFLEGPLSLSMFYVDRM